jgi:hypothetical protein
MGIVAYLNHEAGKWVLSARGESVASAGFEEAVAAAHELIGPMGGGVVYGGPAGHSPRAG